MLLNLEWRKLKGMGELMRTLNVCLDTKRVGTTVSQYQSVARDQ